jgi:hypothetical protein
MRWLVSAVTLFLSVALLASDATAQFDVPPGESLAWPAIDIDGGVAYGSGGLDWTYLGRAGAGLHIINRQRVATVTGVFEMLGSSHKAFGARAELSSIESGLGIGGGVSVSTQGDPGVNVGEGVSLLHVEGMFVFGDHSACAVVGFMRIPLGLVGYGLWGRRQ